MKKFVLALLGISVIAFSSVAQNCTVESLPQMPGTLTADAPYNSGKLPAADLAKHKKVLATISAMIKSKYTPMGVKAGYHENYGYPAPSNPANDYGYSLIPLNFYCDGNTVKVEGETSTFFQISINIMGAPIYESPNNDEVSSGTGFHYIQDMPFEKDGYWYFKEKETSLVLGMPGSGKQSQWLITYGGKLPFAYVTKKEFLETRKKILANSRLESASGFKDILERIEIEKKFKEEEFKNDPDKLQKYMKMDYLEIKSRYEKLLEENENKYKPPFAKIEEQLKLPPAELNAQAIVKQDPNDYLSYLFTDDNDGFGEVLIKPNPGYFDNKLPRSSPQFFSIFLAGSHKDPIAAKFMTDIMKAVDFTKLKGMLGK